MLFKNTITGDIFSSDNPNQSADCVDITNTGEGDSFFLNQAKQAKINDLNLFHDSPAVKNLIIKSGTAQTYIGLAADYRYLIDEQIGLLELRIKQGEKNPIWSYRNGITLPLTLEQLSGIRVYIGSLVDFNFNARRDHETAIKGLKTVQAVNNYDFTKNYKLNQVLNFA
jgi:hypothetical protein